MTIRRSGNDKKRAKGCQQPMMRGWGCSDAMMRGGDTTMKGGNAMMRGRDDGEDKDDDSKGVE